jgi:hypothetical protein
MKIILYIWKVTKKGDDMMMKEKDIIAICKMKSKTTGALDVATLGAKYGISGSTVRRIWDRNQELCK